MPYRPLPWASNLPVEFKKRRGYDLEPILPALVADAGPAGQKMRYDFWETVGELVSENYFGQIQRFGRQHDIPSGGHLLLEENLVGDVALYGNFFQCIRRLDAPSIDCLTSLPPDVPWFIARLLSSAAELEGHDLVMCETSDFAQHYRPPGDKRPRRVVTEAEIRGTCDRLFVSGVNNITSYYSFANLADEQLRRINEWVGRCCWMLRGGHQVADIAVVYPVESVWTKFVPSHHWSADATAATKIEETYRTVADSLFEAQRDFTFVDSRALSEATIQDGALMQGPRRWRVVVLPAVDTLPLSAWENLAQFVRKGGVAIALGARPANSETDFPSTQVQRLAKEIFGDAQPDPTVTTNSAGGAGIFVPAGAELLLPVVLKGVLAPDVKVAERKSPLRVTHRRKDDREVYFVINDGPKPWQGHVSFAAAGGGEEWNPATGAKAGQIAVSAVDLKLEPYGAMFVTFPQAVLPQRHVLAAGVLPNLVMRNLPEAKPTFGKGEFVRGSLDEDAARSGKNGRVWQASAVLTKSQVDTFLFAQFAYPKTVDLSKADCLVLDTWVPPGQRTPSQVLMILHEKDGGDFLANSGRSLGSPGYERTYLPLSRFKLAGWSKDADGELDLTRVTDVRVGWGGYLGKEGEKIDFRFALPRPASVGQTADATGGKK